MLHRQHSCPTDLTFVSADEDWVVRELPQLPSYLASNQRVLAHQGIDGALWALSAQLGSLGAQRDDGDSPGGSDVLCFCNGVQGRDGPACWYELELEDGGRINTADAQHLHHTGYEQGIFPHTVLSAGSLQLAISTMAPLNHGDGCPPRRPAAILYQIAVANPSGRSVSGWLRLRIEGKAYVVAAGEHGWRCPRQSFQRYEGGLSLTIESAYMPSLVFRAETAASVQAEPEPGLAAHFALAPGGTCRFGVWLACEPSSASAGSSSVAILREAPPEGWRASTLRYWNTLLGGVSISPPTRLSEFVTRAAQECLSCIRVDAHDEVVAVVSSPVAIADGPQIADLLFVCWPALCVYPALYARVIAWAVADLIAGGLRGLLDTQARVMPAVMSGLLLQRTGNTDLLSCSPETVSGVERLLESVVVHRESDTGLFPSEVMHGREPLIQFELGTNIECWAAFQGWAEVLDGLRRPQEAARWRAQASDLKESIRRSLVVTGPGEGGWHYAGLRLVAPYRLDPLHYFEHDALDIAVAPFLGFCSERHRPWLNAMEHMFSPYYELVKSRPSTAVWWKPTEIGLRKEKHTAPSIVARLAATQGREEVDRALLALEREIDVNGTLWFRSAAGEEPLARSGRQMGAAYAMLLHRLLGLQVDAQRGQISYRPHHPWRQTACTMPVDGSEVVSAWQAQGRDRAQVLVTNLSARTWRLLVEFRLERALEIERVWLNGQPYGRDACLHDNAGERLLVLECDLPAYAEATAAIEARRKPPADFAEAAVVD